MFVNLHNHSEFSALDGLSKVDEIVRIAKEQGSPAVAVTDHGVCASHPLLQAECDKAGIKPIFGLEAYFVNDRLERPKAGNYIDKYNFDDELTLDGEVENKKILKESQLRLKNDYYHICLWAMNDEGLRNLWAMSTAAYREGYYYRPRLDWQILERLNAGIICGTACLRGPLAVPILANDYELAATNLSRLLSIFGDRLYIELHSNQLDDQIIVNQSLIKMSSDWSVPLVAAVDSHYPNCDDRDLHKVWIAMQTNSDLQDETSLYSGGQDYHMATEDEVYSHLCRYGSNIANRAIANTVVLADRCDARIQGETDPPIFSKPTAKISSKSDLIGNDVDRLLSICLENWDRKVKGKSRPESEYVERFEKEMKMYIDKNFCGYFCIVSDYCQWSKHRSRNGKGCIMGPSRGSGGACLVAYLADIIEIDPIENNLPLARFMTMGRQEPPDFDLDWPASMRDELISYVTNRWGEQNVVRVGTHIRLKNKGVFRDVARVFKTTKPVDPKDLAAISKIIDDEEADSAGLGKSWEVVYAANEDLFAPYRARYPWLFEIAERFVGRLKSYGKHAAGLVISTSDPLIDRLPMRVGEDGGLISDFDFPALEAIGLLKFDLLTLRTLDTLQECVDRIYENTGRVINIYNWGNEYFDESVWNETLANAATMGLFQVETSPVTALMKRVKPKTMAELSAVITLVRPGPTRSGLTDSYIRRKFGKEEIVLPDERLRDALSETYGTIVYQEDIINTCQILAGYSEEEADSVRKILGKKKVAAVIGAGEKFIPACVVNGMELEQTQLLWNQMAEFAKYSFNKAHAYGYAVLCYWTAWFKTHYPLEFLAAALSTVDNDRIPDFVNEAHRLGYKILPPDINESGRGFTTHENVVRYGFEGVKGIGNAATEAILSAQPYTSFDDFLERKGAGCHVDHVLMLAKLGAFDKISPNRRSLVAKLEYQDSEDCGKCVDWTSVLNKYNLPCNYDWDGEPVEFTKTGKPKKRKPVAKKCTKACRNYRPQSDPIFDEQDYSDKEIRDLEMELLGVWLTSTPFDTIESEDLAQCLNASQLESAPTGDHLIAAIVKKATEKIDKSGNKYAWVDLFLGDSDLEFPCWSREWTKAKKVLKPGELVVAVIKKSIRNDRENMSISLAMPA